MQEDNLGSSVSLKSISKSFPVTRSSELRVIEDVSFAVDPGEFLCVLGPSGCGKTTLLKIIAGLEGADSGEVRVGDSKVIGPGFDRAIVFQNFRLLPWRTVLQNVEFGLRAKSIGPEQRRQEAMKYIKLVGLGGFESYYPHQISGGMQQRASLARALTTNPKVLLMDEPLSSLDAQTREVLQAEVLKVWSNARKTIIFVTHSIDEAIYLGQRVIVLSPRPTRIVDTVPVKLREPRWEYDLWKDEAYLETKTRIVNLLRKHSGL